MRRENHLQELQHKAIQAQNGEAVHSGEAEGERRERRSRAARRKQTHRQRAEHARERKAKKSLKVEGWDYMVSLPNPKRSARSARPSASPTLPYPSARAPRVGRTAASHLYLRVVTALFTSVSTAGAAVPIPPNTKTDRILYNSFCQILQILDFTSTIPKL